MSSHPWFKHAAALTAVAALALAPLTIVGCDEMGTNTQTPDYGTDQGVETQPPYTGTDAPETTPENTPATPETTPGTTPAPTQPQQQ